MSKFYHASSDSRSQDCKSYSDHETVYCPSHYPFSDKPPVDDSLYSREFLLEEESLVFSSPAHTPATHSQARSAIADSAYDTFPEEVLLDDLRLSDYRSSESFRSLVFSSPAYTPSPSLGIWIFSIEDLSISGAVTNFEVD